MPVTLAEGLGPARPVFTVRRFLTETTLELTQLDRSVLGWIASFMDADDGDNGRPGVERLSRITGAHEKSVSRSLRRLRDLGLIVDSVDHPRRGLAQSWALSPRLIGEPGSTPKPVDNSTRGEPGGTPLRGTGEFPYPGKGNRGVPKGEPGGSPTDMTDIKNTRAHARPVENSDESGVQIELCEHEFEAGGPDGRFDFCRHCKRSSRMVGVSA